MSQPDEFSQWAEIAESVTQSENNIVGTKSLWFTKNESKKNFV
jgi:hypothetical protein